MIDWIIHVTATLDYPTDLRTKFCPLAILYNRCHDWSCFSYSNKHLYTFDSKWEMFNITTCALSVSFDDKFFTNYTCFVVLKFMFLHYKSMNRKKDEKREKSCYSQSVSITNLLHLVFCYYLLVIIYQVGPLVND